MDASMTCVVLFPQQGRHCVGARRKIDDPVVFHQPTVNIIRKNATSVNMPMSPLIQARPQMQVRKQTGEILCGCKL